MTRKKTSKNRNVASLYKLLHKNLKRDSVRLYLMTFYTRFKLLDPTYTAILEYTCQQKLINCVGNDFKVYEVMINSFFY